MESHDRSESAAPVDADGDDATVPAVGDKPEADALEQARPTSEGAGARAPRLVDHVPEEVPEADWFEQSMAEPIDDEER